MPNDDLTLTHNCRPAPDSTLSTVSPQSPGETLDQSPEDASRADATSGPRITIPGYELECELGRGGMGVVYKARQIGLNRTVALKMVLAGPYADPATRVRFLLEAESVAAMEHPNVVNVYAFGEHNGHPYLAMEYLPGGSLNSRARQGRLSAKDAAELIVRLASAVAHAHSRGVVHRDIKPANVLLTETGDPRLTDFGLAKVGRSDLSVTGQVLGTPAYMAPEQAAGKVHEVGTAADVYALGAVFYDLLTGQPPFQGDSVAVTLQKVMMTEPERPRSLNSLIPRDLETVCLKCLEKEPGKRYPTAQAVADDLNRFLSGEPIGARATSSLERAVKWVKRNKGLAAAVSGVTLALLLGTTVSIAFGLEAKKQAKAAGEAAEREREEAARADQERSTAIDARNDLKKSNDDLLGALANAFLGPIQANGREDGLTPYEVEAFWGIASRRDGPVAFRFLEAATHSPLASRQFENRAEYTLHAAIGLDRELCDKAVRHLTEQLNTTNFPSNQQRALALTCSRMEGGSAAFAVRIVTALVEAMANTKDEVALQQLGKGLVAVVERLSPDDASCSAVAKTLTDSIARSNGSALRELAGGVAALAERLSPDDAARLANRLTEAMARTTDPQDLHPLARALVAVARRLSPDEATRIYSAAAKTLTASTAKTKSSKLRELTEGFAALSERLSPDNAARLANTITAATAKTTNTDPLRKLVAVADERLSSDEATRLTRSLTDAIAKATDPQGLRPLAKGLTVLSGRPLPFDGARIRSTAAKTITDAMAKTTNSDALRKFAAGLAVMAERFPPDEAASACFTAAKILTDAMANATDPYDQHQLAKGLAAVARWVSPDDAARLAKTLTDAMAKTTNSDTLRELAGGVAAVVSRMSPELATRILLDSMLSEGTRPVLAKTLRTFACGLPMLERERVGLLAVGGFGSSCGVLSELPLLRLDFHPQGKPLPAQPLVELLKHPFCVGEPRRAVLDALEFTYNRRFADQWGFVQFVRDNKLPLDLLTPPKRSKP